MNTYFNPVVLMEWVAFIAALFLLYNIPGKWRLFIAWFVLVLLAETIGWFMQVYLHMRFNGLPFNLLMLITVLLETWFLSGYTSRRVQKNARLVMVVFLLAGLINLFFFQGFSMYNSLTEALGDIILSLLCCHILFLLATGNEKTPALEGLDYFWLTVGVLVMSLGSAIHYPFQRSLSEYSKKTGINIGDLINTTLNVVYYTCMIIAFFCRWRSQKLLSASS